MTRDEHQYLSTYHIVPGLEPFICEKKAQLLSIFWVVEHLGAYENSGLKCPMGGTWLTASKNPKTQHRCFRKIEKSHFLSL